VVPQTEITNMAIVFENVSSEFLNPRFVFVVDITFEESSVEFNDLPKC
jgi:hypothetical protein